MAGISFIATGTTYIFLIVAYLISIYQHFDINYVHSGDLWQLPPILDNLVTDNNHLDGRPDCSPSHWEEHFKIFYLTEKNAK